MNAAVPTAAAAHQLLDQVRLFARYGAWANARLAAVVRALDESDYRADRGLFFRSIHGTLNHLLVVDRLWFHRLTDEHPGVLPKALDEIVEDDREALLEARAVQDARLVAFCAVLDGERLAETVSYTVVAGDRFAQPMTEVLAHVFNHQTHHRGHVHAALTGLGRDAPALDLIYFLRELP